MKTIKVHRHNHHNFHHDVGGLSLPRRTTNDLAGGASEASPVPLPDPLANGCEAFRSRRTTNERTASAGLSASTPSPGRTPSPSLCRRGLRSWNQYRFLGWLTSGESSSVTGLTTSESCDCLRYDDGALTASWDDGRDVAAVAGTCSITALCDFLRT